MCRSWCSLTPTCPPTPRTGRPCWTVQGGLVRRYRSRGRRLGLGVTNLDPNPNPNPNPDPNPTPNPTPNPNQVQEYESEVASAMQKLSQVRAELAHY